MIKVNKNQLDLLGTILGAIAGIAGVFAFNEVGNPKVMGTVAGIATVLLGVVTQKPASASPTTEDVEEDLN